MTAIAQEIPAEPGIYQVCKDCGSVHEVRETNDEYSCGSKSERHNYENFYFWFAIKLDGERFFRSECRWCHDRLVPVAFLPVLIDNHYFARDDTPEDREKGIYVEKGSKGKVFVYRHVAEKEFWPICVKCALKMNDFKDMLVMPRAHYYRDMKHDRFDEE